MPNNPNYMLLILMHVQSLVKIHLFILKILSGNKILTSFKGRNSVMKWMLNNPKIDDVNINACAKLAKIHLVIFQILSGNQILTSFKGHNLIN